MTAAIRLRPAGNGDRDRVYAINCSPRARLWSKNQRDVSYEEHARWFADRLADRSTRMWIIEENGVTVGVVRIDAKAQPRMSIALVEGTQGRHIGRRAIALACDEWGGAVTAEIHEANTASHAAFVASGFMRVGNRDGFHLYLWSP